jgi:hypothetical protein
MKQAWLKGVKLDKKVIEKCNKIKPVDILVGVLCKNVETTILNVLNVINEGLYRYFPDHTKAIVICKGESTDQTDDAIELFKPYNSVKTIVTNDIIKAGKGSGIRTIFEIGHKTQAKTILLVDGDLLSIKPNWIVTMANPIIFGRADLTVPYYIRDKNDAVITNNLVYPFTRALYRIDIRQPIAGEYALSKPLYELLRNHPLFPPDFGVDIFILTVAAAEGFYVKEGLFSLKIHESTTRYLEPEKFLVPMFRKVTGSMFNLADFYEKVWKKKPDILPKKHDRECFSQKPISVRINIPDMKNSFKHEYVSNHKVLEKYLPEDIVKDLELKTKKKIDIDADLWTKIVYYFASNYKKMKTKSEKENLLNALKTLWVGRFISYAIQVKKLDINQAERIIQKQAETFENNLELLKMIY